MTELFPPLEYSEWSDTLATVHRFSQVVGKLRLAHSPRRNHWWNVPFHLTGRGITTRPMGLDPTFALEFDYLAHRLRVDTTDGRSAAFGLAGHSVATFHAELTRMLAAVGVDPAAIADAHPFDLPDADRRFADDTEHAAYDPAAVGRYWRILAQVNVVLEEFAGRFSGKTSPVHHFWHTFDIASDPVRRRRRRPAGIGRSGDPGGVLARGHQLGVLVRRPDLPRGRVLLLHRARARRARRSRPARARPAGSSGAAATWRSCATTTPAPRRTRRGPCSTSWRPRTGQVRSEPAGTSTGTPASTVPPTRCWSGADNGQPRAGGSVHDHRPGRGQVAQLRRPTRGLPTRAAGSRGLRQRRHPPPRSRWRPSRRGSRGPAELSCGRYRSGSITGSSRSTGRAIGRRDHHGTSATMTARARSRRPLL